MTVNDLTVKIDHLDCETLLSDWHWLIGDAKLPILATLAGDMFVQDVADSTIHFLDVVEGTCTEVAADEGSFRALLCDRDFVMKYLSVQLVAPLIRAGSVPPAGQILSWRLPPVVGGSCTADNLDQTDIEVHFSMLGPIWRQASSLPPGTVINKFTTE